MTQPIETIMHLAAGILRTRGYGPTRLRMPATIARDYNPETGFWDIVLPTGAGSFPGETKLEFLKDGEVVFILTENTTRLWGLNEEGVADRCHQIMEIVG